MARSSDNFFYFLLKQAIQVLACVPWQWLTALAIPLGRIWYGLDHYHRRIALENISIAFGRELDPAGIRNLARNNFIQLVRVMLELPSLLRLKKDNIDSYVQISGLEHLETALARGKGVLALTAHLGNWELMAVATALKFGTPFNVMARPLDFAPMDRVLTEIRSRTGNRVLDKDKSAGEVAPLLEKNETIGILLDQNASWFEGVYVPFFGKVACTNKGLAIFALRYDATVLPVFNTRRDDGRYHVVFYPPVDLVRSTNISSDILENTRRFNQIIEEAIRKAPDNWLWVHRRWRMKAIPERARRKIKGIID